MNWDSFFLSSLFPLFVCCFLFFSHFFHSFFLCFFLFLFLFFLSLFLSFIFLFSLRNLSFFLSSFLVRLGSIKRRKCMVRWTKKKDSRWNSNRIMWVNGSWKESSWLCCFIFSRSITRRYASSSFAFLVFWFLLLLFILFLFSFSFLVSYVLFPFAPICSSKPNLVFK